MALVIRTTGVEEFLDSNGEPNIKALIMGQPSAGKTRAASFWPDPIFADCEQGRMSIADRRVPFAEIKSSRDMEDLLNQLEIHAKTTPPPQRKYKTLVIDTLDAYQRVVVQEILRAGKKESMSGWQDWGQLDAKMTNLIARLHRLPMNIIVNLHIKASQDGDDGPLIHGPKLKGDLREQIAAEFDLVGHMATWYEAVEGKRTLKRGIKWQSEPTFPILKDRSGQLPAWTDVNFEDKDYVVLFETIYGEAFDALKQQETVEEIEQHDDVEAPRDGGPVAVKGELKPSATRKATVAKAAPPKAAAPQAASPAAPVQAEPAPRVKKAAPPPAAQPTGVRRPPPQAAFTEPKDEEAAGGQQVAPAETEDDSVDDESDEAMDAAVAVVQEQLGGEVIATEDSEGTHPVEQPAVTTPSPAAEEEQVGSGLLCGTSAKNAKKDPTPGCGKDLGGEDEDLVNIALIKTQTYLCPSCLQKWRSSNK